jgi:hypothetical protein
MGARQFAVRTFGRLNWAKIIDKSDAKIYASVPYENRRQQQSNL